MKAVVLVDDGRRLHTVLIQPLKHGVAEVNRLDQGASHRRVYAYVGLVHQVHERIAKGGHVLCEHEVKLNVDFQAEADLDRVQASQILVLTALLITGFEDHDVVGLELPITEDMILLYLQTENRVRRRVPYPANLA